MLFLACVLCGVFVRHVLTSSTAFGDRGPPADSGALRGGRALAEPEDHFTLEQRRHGALLLHLLGLFYMFIGIAIVCDECFVPALEVIVEVLELSNDVAGATFMAAGGSAPEFFTSLIGAIFVESDIGTGTIIGSAVFNVLFVIGACGVAAREPIKLTAFPLARDSVFYAVDLMVIVAVFLDEKVHWWEALILFSLYVVYSTFMAFSAKIEAYVKSLWPVAASEQAIEKEDKSAESFKEAWAAPRERESPPAAGTGEDPATNGGDVSSPRSLKTQKSMDASGKGQFRHKAQRVSYVAHSGSKLNLLPIIPVGDSTGGSACGEIGSSDMDGGGVDGGGGSGEAAPQPPTPQSQHPMAPCTTPPRCPSSADPTNQSSQDTMPKNTTRAVSKGTASSKGSSKELKEPESEASVDQADAEASEEGTDMGDDPLNFYPPGPDAGKKDWLWYFASLPIVFCLVCTIPDVRREGCKKYFMLTFFMSIVWIAAFTWVMVWFATVIAETCGMSEVIMGLTILAAGTSVPDLITSMLVARDGFGDMAVSSSIGSNIFDVTVGLPVPWLLYGAVRNGKPVVIKNEGLEISVMLLLAMLGFTIFTIMWYNWTMTRPLGASLLALYLIFEVVAVGLTFAPEGSLKLIHV